MVAPNCRSVIVVKQIIQPHQMNHPSRQTFGLLIAFVIPGAVTLWGLSFITEEASWLMAHGQQPSIGGFLYVTLASVGLGMTVSAIRWLVFDTFHHYTGLRSPDVDFRELRPSVGAYLLLVEFHYRYYQFYANMLVATLFAYPVYRLTAPTGQAIGLTDLMVLVVVAVYAIASRDALKKYYERVTELLEDKKH